MTPRDLEILQVLTHRLRVLSTNQIAAVWWNGNLQAAGRRMAVLQRQRLVILTPTLAQTPPVVQHAVACWRPGMAPPDFGGISYRLKQRWKKPLTRSVVVIATQSTAARFGGFGGRMPRASELSHDLGLATVYILFRGSSPSRAKGWQSEAALYDRGEGRNCNLPDAMVVTRSERTIIEYGGAYSKPKLMQFHETCIRRSWAYEIW